MMASRPRSPGVAPQATLVFSLLLAAVPFSAGAEAAHIAAGTLSAGTPAAERLSPLSLEDLTLLLREGVGAAVVIRQVERTGVSFGASMEDLLALRRAGAPDDLLEAVMRQAERRDEPDEFRIFSARDGEGREVIVLTNLDENGRRIGGEVLRPGAANIVSSGPEPRRRPAGTRRAPEVAEGSRAPGREPVVVVLREPAAPPPPPPEPPDPCRRCGSRHSCGTAIGCGVPVGCGVLATGGVVGPFRYPDKLWFLGYAPGGGPVSPSFDARGNVRIQAP